MTAALAFPGSRILAGWWRQLAEHRPEALWVGHLLLHHLEALVARTTARQPAALDLLVLRALARTPGAAAADLDQRLFLGLQVLHQVLRQMAASGLARENGGWTVTDLGRQALERGDYACSVRERRSFYFLGAEQPGQPAHYLPLRPLATVPWTAEDGWEFAVPELTAWLGQPLEVRRRYGFPLDVDRLVRAGDEGEPAWRSVIFDRPERLVTALLPRAAQLTAFAVRQDGWNLLTAEPALELAEHWPELFPLVAAPASAADLQAAWQGWCQPRHLGGLTTEVSDLRLEGQYLHATPSARLLDRLRGEALREESWVLVGTGRLRRAAIVKVGEAR